MCQGDILAGLTFDNCNKIYKHRIQNSFIFSSVSKLKYMMYCWLQEICLWFTHDNLFFFCSVKSIYLEWFQTTRKFHRFSDWLKIWHRRWKIFEPVSNAILHIKNCLGSQTTHRSHGRVMGHLLWQMLRRGIFSENSISYKQSLNLFVVEFL